MTHFNSGSTVYDPLVVYVPDTIVGTCRAIQNRKKGMEFSILCKGAFGDGGYLINEDFVIPHQAVTGAEVDFTDTAELEGYHAEGFNVIIHSHPFKSETFSSSDRTTLSTNYECSLLFSGDTIVAGTVSIKIGEAVLVLDAKVSPLSMFLQLPDNFDELVKNKTFAQGCNYNEFDVWGNKLLRGVVYKKVGNMRTAREAAVEVIPTLASVLKEVL